MWKRSSKSGTSASGSKFFVEEVKDKLGFKTTGRKVVSTGDVYELKEGEAPYNSDFVGIWSGT